MFLDMNRREEILQRKGHVNPVKFMTKPTKYAKTENIFKTRTQLLEEFLKKHNGPLTLQNSKFLNAQVKLHKRRKEEANKRRKIVVINQPTRTIFKPKSPKKAAAKPKSPKKAAAKCNTPRCKALKMKNQKVCDAKIKNGGEFCKRHRKK